MPLVTAVACTEAIKKMKSAILDSASMKLLNLENLDAYGKPTNLQYVSHMM